MTPLAFEVVALVCAGLFAGAAACVTFVEHPARVSAGPGVAIAEFRPLAAFALLVARLAR